MNVLLLDLGRELRGGQRQVFYLLRELVRQGYHAVVACPRNSALATLVREEHLPLIPLPGRSLANPLVLLTLLYALRKHHLQIIHTHDAHAATLGAALKSLSPSRKLIHTRRVSYPPHAGARLRKYLKADAIVGVSAEISAGMVAVGIAEDKVRTIHSGIDPTRYQPKSKEPHPQFVFQSIGALTPQKGYSVLIKALAVLKQQTLPPWEMRIVGEGILFQSLLDEATALGVDTQLALLGRQESRLVLPLCDALIVPSVDGEGSSGAIKEGWVTGVPVVCSDLLSNTELVQHEHNGLLATAGDPEALAAAMRRCLTEPALRDQLVQQGTLSVAKYTDQRMAEGYLSLYNDLLTATPSPH